MGGEGGVIEEDVDAHEFAFCGGTFVDWGDVGGLRGFLSVVGDGFEGMGDFA